MNLSSKIKTRKDYRRRLRAEFLADRRLLAVMTETEANDTFAQPAIHSNVAIVDILPADSDE